MATRRSAPEANKAADAKTPKTPKTKPKAPRKAAAEPQLIDSAEARFVAEYLLDFNGTRAYQVAYPGVTPGSARVLACRKLAKVHIQDAIAAGAKRIADKLELTKERIYLETARLAFFDPRRMFHEDGRPKSVAELDDDTAACIAGLEVLEEFSGQGEERKLIGHVKKYRVADKNSALDRAAKLLALFGEDNRQRVDALAEVLALVHQQGSKLPIRS